MRGLGRLRSIELRLNAARVLLPHAHELHSRSHASAATLLERNARMHPQVDALLFQDRRYCWAEVNALANRWARLLLAEGVARGDVIALVMDNRPEYVFALLGASKIHAVTACVNVNISGAALAHAVGITRASVVLVGSEHEASVERVLGEVRRFGPPPKLLVHADDGAPPEREPINDRLLEMDPRDVGGPAPSASDRMTYLYTSGTTGLPKAAIVTNQRFLLTGYGFGKIAHSATPADVIYVALPLYHGTGQWGGLGASLATGATLALRRKFSASAFWKDAVRFRATSMLYIGELCRYLVNQPPAPEDTSHSVKIAVGNGLRPDVWEPFQSRFGIPLIREFYGATEGNAPIVNLEGKRGMLGRLVGRQELIVCDLETGAPRRRGDGRCERLERPGETGLYVGRIGGTMKFDGYIDTHATNAKILRDVFRKGDAWFNSGDLMTLHDDRWVSFADRVGDTFRWKGENVSTSEVALLLNRGPGVVETNVFGVSLPGTEGKAGMACLVVAPDFDIDAFSRYTDAEVPRYARPLFVRLLEDMRVTSTLKQQKSEYRSEGYDPARIGEPLYASVAGRYQPLTHELYSDIRSGRLTPA